ncbi:camk protein kinase [Botryosphaeria dothidea]|uniref:Camk protein kinase n=1 Tax=Botryosphaeria dothidea TaxID=55169 RepID=A0A8H4INV8_9PEZI|nr:camk protein kinase [Botryosphaeria dothidea]
MANSLTYIVDLKTQIPIYARDEFSLGRDSPQLEHAHGTISKRHVKFHCIVFEDDGQWSIPPLVYAEDVSTNGTYLRRAQTPVEDQPDPRGILMRSSIRITLLEENDELWFHPSVFLRYHVNKDLEGEDPPFPSAVIGRRFQVEKRKIGEGGHGAVHIAVHRKTQRQLACKIVPLDIVRQQQNFCEEKLTQEFEILRDLDHPNIIRLEKVFHSHTNLYIFQELVPGGDLFSFMDKSHPAGVSAIEAAVIVQQILRGVDYLHEHGIVHRDLKPDNILLSSTKGGCRVVITDFGQSRYLPNSEHSVQSLTRRMNTLVGTVGYIAPEVYRRNPKIIPESGYSKAVDIWSVGCITSYLVCGKPIFRDGHDENSDRAIQNRSIECNLDLLDDDSFWQNVGRRAKDFIRRSLVLDEDVRMTAKQALQHEWFSNPTHADEFEAVYQHAIQDWI